MRNNGSKEIEGLVRAGRPEEYGQLFAIQKDSIGLLDNVYSEDEINSWLAYLDKEGPRRFANFQNAVCEGTAGDIYGFVSWSVHDDIANIDCLYVRPQYQGKGVGKELLLFAESACSASHMLVRSTLNAQAFYEREGYILIDHSVSRAGFEIVRLKKNNSYTFDQ